MPSFLASLRHDALTQGDALGSRIVLTPPPPPPPKGEGLFVPGHCPGTPSGGELPPPPEPLGDAGMHGFRRADAPRTPCGCGNA